ncbi:HAD family hydrolase [Lachnospiraceae bacterium 62-35]
MKKKYILFDLDGTLTDPEEGITKAVAYALCSFGIEVTDRRELIPFIGPPLRDSYMEYYGFSQEKAREGVIKYREYFNERGWKENKVYEGIPEMLWILKEKGFRLMVATSKPEVFAVRILEYFGLAQYFEFIGGADLEEIRVRKGDVIRYVMEKMGISPLEAIMVGDRKHDAIGAEEAGIDCIGVLFGYGSREELEGVQTCYLAESVADLQDYLLKD